MNQTKPQTLKGFRDFLPETMVVRNYVKKASVARGDTGLLFARLLEQRLDNVVYRLGLARSRGEAREYVSHGHFMVNGKKVNIPSYCVRIGDTIEVRPKSQTNKFFKEVIAPRLDFHEVAKWLTRENNALCGRVIAFPEEDDIPQNFNRKMIIEFYSR